MSTCAISHVIQINTNQGVHYDITILDYNQGKVRQQWFQTIPKFDEHLTH